MAKIDKQAIRDAYEEVRNDSSDTNWAVLKYDGSEIVLGSTGSSFEDFASNFTDDDRIYGFLRVVAGDELSKRTKFALIVWLGKNVSGIKRARMGTDKSSVKEVIRSYAVELMINEKSELNEDFIIEEIKKAGGANYGTGTRD
uniref:Coactosin-like protein n=1 Tax=Crassostrea virginica TaxID=6565 RepID=A0A8B8EQ11_CRAVI|nr:coactosin-like protein [Crassostrea virginica]